MGQAVSKTLEDKSDVFYDYNDISNRFTKVTLSTLTVPIVVVAFPLLNAYTFAEEEFTGAKVMDGAIGGILGVIGWPLAPFLACWSFFNKNPSGPLPIPLELKEHVKKTIGLNSDQFYNVAIVGGAGTGKSSLVNGILGYHDAHPLSAPIGETEATVKPTGYRHPDLRTMVLWDMPATSTMNHPTDTYFEDKFLCAFDSIVIVTSERFQQVDILLAKKAKEWKVPVLFVRNKADQAIDFKMRCYLGKKKEEWIWTKAVGELTREVHHSTVSQLKANKISSQHLFVLSAWNLQEFIFQLSQRHMDGHMRLIDEERFVRRLIQGVASKRKRKDKDRQMKKRQTTKKSSL